MGEYLQFSVKAVSSTYLHTPSGAIRYVYHIYPNCICLRFIVMEVKILDLLVWRWWYFICITKAFSDLRKWFHTMNQTEPEILCEDWAVQKRFLLLSRQHRRRMYIRLKANTVLSKEEIFKCSGLLAGFENAEQSNLNRLHGILLCWQLWMMAQTRSSATDTKLLLLQAVLDWLSTWGKLPC